MDLEDSMGNQKMLIHALTFSAVHWTTLVKTTVAPMEDQVTPCLEIFWISFLFLFNLPLSCIAV